MAGGGKGGSQSTQVTIPAWLEDAAKRNLALADQVSQIGYTPYYGPDVAAFTPMQQASFANTGTAANAFGLQAPTDPMAGMPAPQTFAGGVQGYSSAPMYEEALAALEAARPGQFKAINDLFINPQTGALPVNAAAQKASDAMSGMGGGKGGSFVEQTPERPDFAGDMGGTGLGGFGGFDLPSGSLAERGFDAAFGNPFGGFGDTSSGMGGGK